MERQVKSSIILSAVALACLAATQLSVPAWAQKQQSEAERVLITKAQALESRGRPDIAVQVWQQILASDPNNSLALEGVARDYRLSGNSTASDDALDKLRKINPSNPNINSIQGLTSNKTRDARLSQAGQLAKAGNPEAAMKIYREYYGDHPPDGDIALAYYETLYGTPNGKGEALNAMRALAARNPGDPRFIVTLGRMLTYDARTRAEGIKVLHEHMDNYDAQNSLRQALIWDSSNPASAAELREYLKTHPKDSELEDRLKANEGKLAEMNAGIARTAEEKAAFAALNAHNLPDAEARFMAMLDKNERDPRAAAGMGFLRMQQSNFGGAISYLVQAEQNGFRDHSVVEGLATSRFWFTMGEASTAFDAGQLDVAAEKYQTALQMRPRSPEALNGLAGVYTKNEQFPQATAIYQQIIKQNPSSLDAWRGIFLGYSRQNQYQQAVNTMAHFPPHIKAQLMQDPDFLRNLASIYQSEGRDIDAQHILAQALSLPFPDNGANLKNGTRLQYAGILMQAKRFDQAALMYEQVLNEDTTSLPAWMGLVTADHQLQHDAAAIETVEKMPPDTYEAALADPGFLSMLGSIYAQSNQFEIAQGLLERSMKVQTKNGGQPTIGLELQLAAVYLQRNNTEQAYGLYRTVLQAHPDSLDAWRGLIGTLQLTNRNSEALAQIKLIPTNVRRQLESDILFEQTEASLYASSGDAVNALALFNRVQKHYQALGQDLPADIAIQSAYLLYNAKDDRALYPALMALGGRPDLTVTQRETVEGIWANWSVRRAGFAFDAGNSARAIDILDAAAQAFPDNLMVRKAVAGGYLRVGKAKESLAIYKQVDYQDASANDFDGAIGAALAANDKAQAEDWLRQALERYPQDSSTLALAARFEAARGDNGRAADYWRASIAAMPAVSPSDRLAHELVNPEQGKAYGRAATASDLADLLNPDREQAGRAPGAKLPPLPSYGHDPYDPGAPVVLAPQTRAPTQPVYPVATTTTTPLPASETALAAPARPIPQTQPAPQPVPQQHVAQDDPQPAQAPRRRVRHTTVAPYPTVSTTTTAPKTTITHRKRIQKPDTDNTDYTGQMNLPANSQDIDSTLPPWQTPLTAKQPRSQPAQQFSPQATTPQTNLPPDSLPPPQFAPHDSTQPSSQTPSSQSTLALPGSQPTSQGYTPGSQARPQNYAPPNVPAAPNYPQQAPKSQPVYPQMVPQSAPAPSPQQKLSQPQSEANLKRADPTFFGGLKLSNQPMNSASVQAQSFLIDQTDSQLTQGLAIHYLSNAPLPSFYPGTQPAAPNQTPNPTYNNAQYTPSATDAASGAYSAQKPITQTPQPPPLQAAPPQQPMPQAQAQPTQPAPKLTGKTRKRRKAAQGQSVPTLVTAPPQQAPTLPVTDAPVQGTQSTTDTGLTDKELEERNLPPLRGPWLRTIHREPAVLNPRDEAEMQLRTIEGGYSAWLGGTGTIAHRTGTAGYDALTSLDTQFEASVPLGTKARLTFIARPVFLNSGQADGNAIITLASGVAPEPIGTEDGTTATTTPPSQQNAAGIGGEAQLTFANLAVGGGYTPYGFLIGNFIGHASWRPNRGPFTLTFNRDSVKDTQLSYSGLRDPGSATAVFPGNAWGGVIANSGNVQYAKGDLNSGFYVGAGGQYITGYHVLDNKRIDGSAGAYFRVYTAPEYGSLNVGANFFAMHYTTNLQAFTYGMGGYFSPHAYFLANVPITWTGHYLTRWHYNILGSFGIQAFQQNTEPLYPLDQAIEISQNNPALPNMTSVGPNYDIRAQVAYAISDHWFAGGFASANNSRDYTNVNAGFSIRYMFRSQPSTVAGPTGLFQTDDSHALRPLTVP